MTHVEHKSKVPSKIGFAIVVVSDSRYRQFKDGVKIEDESSPIAERLIKEKGYEFLTKEIVPDDTAKIVGVLLRLVGLEDCDVILTIGGTGLSVRDVTIESVQKLLTKEVVGFGEVFRSLSFQRIGTASILSRASAGVIRDKLIFCLPGSPQSIELGLRELILPEVGHMLRHIRE
ncbi:MAG: molybdenum cofactor biosynthesis protein B [Promethearchaeati archaeon SRVP18_Atabeyarchaeia-1]